MQNFTILLLISFALLSGCSSSKYVNYLENNTEVKNMDEPLTFTSLDEEFYENDLFLIGEIHEVGSSPRIDVAMFKQIHENTGIDFYIAEMDMVQGYYIQKYLEGSNEKALEDILKNWSVTIGRFSQQYRNKWVEFRKYYSQLPDEQKFEVVGLDFINDYGLMRELLNQKLPVQLRQKIPLKDSAFLNQVETLLDHALNNVEAWPNDSDIALMDDLYDFVKLDNTTRSREKFMYLNFKKLYQRNKTKNKTYYGVFGFNHTLQAYDNTFAGYIKKDSDLPIAESMVSMNALYVDSKLAVDSRALPKILQDKGKHFTRFNFSYDSRLFMYIQGIADYKRVTKPNSISLIKLDTEGSPYLTSTRGTKTKQLIPVWDGIDIIDGTATTDYAQYIFLVRNADWIKPDNNDLN